ncbi:MAG: hypothetical protein WKF43_04915 [Acidimicrobiales bacterium]
MTDPTATIDTYFRMWNETDPNVRAELVGEAWAEDGRHVDPLADVEGHRSIDEMVAGVQGQFPGATIRRTSAVDLHHDQARYAWELSTEDGDVVVSAIDVARLAGDGRLQHVAAFFGDLTAEVAA